MKKINSSIELPIIIKSLKLLLIVSKNIAQYVYSKQYFF
jgi:hypothetical protein